MEIKELIAKIEQWGIDRELDKKGTVKGQQVKSCEEMAELIIGISKDNIEVIKDSIGDVIVTLIIGNMLDEKYDFNKILNEAESDYTRLEKHFLDLEKIQVIESLSSHLLLIARYGYSDDLFIKNAIYCLKRIANIYKLEIKDCLAAAYKEIAGRRGQMVNGTFVKEEDLRRR